MSGQPSDPELERVVVEDAEAWQAYGAAVRRGAPRQVRRSFFERAMRTLRRVADVCGERPWPRTREWR